MCDETIDSYNAQL